MHRLVHGELLREAVRLACGAGAPRRRRQGAGCPSRGAAARTERKPQDGTSNAGDLFSASGVGLGATLIFESDASNLATNKRRQLRSRVRLIPGV